MEYNLSVSDRKRYLQIRINESVTVELLEDFVRESPEKAKECEINKFLFDLRYAPKRTTSTKHYEIVYSRSRQLGFKPGSKHALVVNQEDMDDCRFVETILINAGYQGKMFTDELAAIVWLEKWAPTNWVRGSF